MIHIEMQANILNKKIHSWAVVKTEVVWHISQIKMAPVFVKI